MENLKAQDVCVAWPPYRSLKLQKTTAEPLRWLEDYEGSIDSYCVKCRAASVFTTKDNRKIDVSNIYLLVDHNFQMEFTCSRNRSHRMWFYFRLESEVFQKVGQWPSHGDIHIKELDKYVSVIDDIDRSEFARAIGLAAHDVGIGSFVYLRRVFERRMESARIVAAKETGWDQVQYEKMRMNEKIKHLNKYLPDTLVANAGIYSILSLGIHELTEDDCRKYFDTLRVGIELMFDDMLREKEKLSKAEALKKSVQAMQSELSTSK